VSREGWLKRAFENFGKAPEEAPEPLIPQRLRVPVFLGMVVVGVLLLALLLWFVVLPAIRAQGNAAHSAASVPLAATRTLLAQKGES